MASTSCSSTLSNTKLPTHHSSSSSSTPQCVTLPTLPPPPFHHSLTRSSVKTTAAHCRRIARNVVAFATGEVPAAAEATELPEIVKTVQQAWEKIDDKYAVGSLAVASLIAVWASTGMISAIDRLPVIPGVFELVGIGYSGWFAYRNVIFKPDREALLAKIKDAYNDILGSS